MKNISGGRRSNVNRLSTGLVLAALLFTCFAASAGWCYYVCGTDGVKNENWCTSECGGTCIRYTFTMKVTCYFCDVGVGTCAATMPVVVPATKYITSCGENPYLSGCQCLEPYILDGPSSINPCPTVPVGSPCWW